MSNEKRTILESISQKSVTIQIAEQDWMQLREAGYQLCFAKKVVDSYDVVWQSYGSYLMTNQFSWTPQFQIFGTNIFEDNVTVQQSTSSVSIGLGQTILLDGNGHFGPATVSGPANAISMINDYGVIHPGLSQLATGIDGTQVISPIYVQQQESGLGNTSMTPVDMILVWFEQNIETSTMFSTEMSLSVEIDLTATDSATRLYQNEQWVTP